MKLAIFLALLVGACAACNVVEDGAQPTAVDAGDKTLIQYIKPGADALSNCLALPNGGFDVCRFIEHADINSSWNILLPSGSALVGNQVVIFYRDIQKTYSANGNLISIPFADILQATKWEKSLEGEVEALAMIQYKDAQGVVKTARALGIARILVLPSTYNVLPLDSGVQAYSQELKCKLQMATSGRSAYECK